MSTTPAAAAAAAGGAASTVRTLLAHTAGMLLALVLLPLCLAIGVPFQAWAIAFGLVVFNRVVADVVAWSVRDSSITVTLGALGFSMIFRALFSALTLFFVGASVGADGDQPIGMDQPDIARAALIIFILCFTLDVGIETIRRAGQREFELANETTPAQETPA